MLRIHGAKMRQDREHDERAWLAWHIAYLPRSKRPVRLKEMQTRNNNKRKQTYEEQISIAYAWTAALAKVSPLKSIRTEK
jgi:hypothetical protein